MNQNHVANDHRNDYLLSYNQLKSRCDYKTEQINALKLEKLNSDRMIVSLINRQDTYKRLLRFISQEDIPRLKQVIAVCLKNGRRNSFIIMNQFKFNQFN
jgi:hypothetical protein